MSDILKLSAYEMRQEMEQGRLSALEATEAYLAEIRKREPEVGAYLLVEEERAKAQAQSISEEIEKITNSEYINEWAEAAGMQRP